MTPRYVLDSHAGPTCKSRQIWTGTEIQLSCWIMLTPMVTVDVDVASAGDGSSVSEAYELGLERRRRIKDELRRSNSLCVLWPPVSALMLRQTIVL